MTTGFDAWAADSRQVIEHELARLEQRSAALRTLLEALCDEAPTNGTARTNGHAQGQRETLTALTARVLRDGMTMPEIKRAVLAIRPDARGQSIRTSVDWLRKRDSVRTQGIGTARRYYHAP